MAVDGSRPTWFVDRTGPYLAQVSGSSAPLPQVGWSDPSAWTTDLAPNQGGRPALLDLPRDPLLLRAALYRDAIGRGQSLDGEVLVEVDALLRQGYAPADLRAALFDVLKHVPGVDIVEGDVTLDGRRGVALGRRETNAGGRLDQIVFDRATGEYLGSRSVYPDLGGAIIETAVRRALVDAVDPAVVASAVRHSCTVEREGTLCRPS